ncbi:cation-translocating P-type ATPase [Aquabacterium sp.]|uniref:cation-translocating P-type ATPase n=1 Tax=Aquabacterium sp. TaxID=1872578 RepID=UPI0025C5921F|nr:cation-translocating P-type ATPase [Aquabacterium sp.]
MDTPSPQGLSQAEARARLQAHGFNELPQTRQRSVWRMAAEVLREPMLQLLLAAGGIYLLLGDRGEALMLMTFVALTIGISLHQERRTERVLEALRDLSSPRALVLRDGQRCRIAGREVVPGDWLVLAEGDRVPADAVVREAQALQADESLLTGESVPVRKAASGEAVSSPAWAAVRPGGDDLAMVFAGSLVVGGHGLAEVVATGARSQMGAIGQALQAMEAMPSALQRQTRQMVRLFAVLGLGLSALVIALHGCLRGDWLAAVLNGITLAMSMLPQEFPLILTVFMAMGAWRLSAARVLVRRASAIETLGAATVLCTDKTGTLTLNRMAVAELCVAGQTWRVTDSLPEAFHPLLEYGVLASQTEPLDPMEQALWRLAREQLPEPDRIHMQVHLHPDWRLAREYALSPELLAMSHVWEQPGHSQHLIAAKGAPEAVADLCHLPEALRAVWRLQAEAMAARGLRVLGVAQARHEGPAPGEPWPAIQHDYDFEFLGLIGWLDPLRPGVQAAVARCREAGIRVAMVTGDHPATALAIAEQAGIDVRGGALRGEALQGLSDAELALRVRDTHVFARVMPEQKLRIVRALQASGEIVAMTGDGVNDAPSLKAADIGVAMGARGTDVAREAASLVLLDDDFQAIAQAVHLGRRINDNLRKAMAFVLAVHVPIAGLTLWPLLAGWPLLFMPVHIAFLELIIDPVCSVVFEAEAAEPDAMRRPPRRPGAALIDRAQVLWSLLQGAVVLACVGGWYAWLLSQDAGAQAWLGALDEAQARTAGFVALVVADVALILSNRTLTQPVWVALGRANGALWRMLLATGLVLGCILLWAPLRGLFHFGPLSAPVLGGAVAVGVACLLLLELLKAARAAGSVRTV